MKKIIAISCATAILGGCQISPTPTNFKPVSVQAVPANSEQSLTIANDAVELLKKTVGLEIPLEFKPVGGLGQVLAFKLQEAGYSVHTRSVSGSIPVSYTLDSLDSMRLFMLRAGNYQVNRVYKSSSNGLALVSSSAHTHTDTTYKNIFSSKKSAPVSTVKPNKRKFVSAKAEKRSLLIGSMTSEIEELERELLGLKKPEIKRVAAKPQQRMIKKPVREVKTSYKKPTRLISREISVMPKKEVVNVQELISPFDVTALFSSKQLNYIEKQSHKATLPANIGMEPSVSKGYFLQVFASRDNQLLQKNQRLITEKGYQSKIVKTSGMGVLRIYSDSYKELVNVKRALKKQYDDSYIRKVAA